VAQLARYYGVAEYTCLMEPAIFYGNTEAEMRETYNCFDVAISTTQGEGFGLTTLEAMACGVPVIIPDWAALGEWTKDAAWLVQCTSTAMQAPGGTGAFVNVIGGVPDKDQFIFALQRLYMDKAARAQNAQAALERAQEPRFRWPQIGEEFTHAFQQALTLDVGEKQAEEQALLAKST
jgi:D-inositol-3-phosphate glycosyltransferase